MKSAYIQIEKSSEISLEISIEIAGCFSQEKHKETFWSLLSI